MTKEDCEETLEMMAHDGKVIVGSMFGGVVLAFLIVLLGA